MLISRVSQLKRIDWSQIVSSYKNLFSIPIRFKMTSSSSNDQLVIDKINIFFLNKAKIGGASKENIDRELEEICYNLSQAGIGSNFKEYLKCLNHLQENFGQLKLSRNSIGMRNEYTDFILNKTIEALEQDYSLNNVLELMKFCDFFEVDDPTIYSQIAQIIKANHPHGLLLERRLRIMSEFNHILPLVDKEELFPVSLLGFKETLYLLYLVSVNNHSLIEHIDEPMLLELQNKLCDSIHSKLLVEIKEDLPFLFITMAHFQKSTLQSFSFKMAQVIDALNQNLFDISTEKLIEIYKVIHKQKSIWDVTENISIKIAEVCEQRIKIEDFKVTSDLMLLILESSNIPDLPQFLQEANKKLIVTLILDALPDKANALNISYPLLLGMIDLCAKWETWSNDICQKLSSLMIALFEIERITVDIFVKLLSKITKLNNGKIPEKCLSLLRLRKEDFIAQASMRKLVRLGDLLRDCNSSELAVSFEKVLSVKMFEGMKNKDPQMIKLALNENMFSYIIRRIRYFSQDFIQLYASMLEENLKLFSEQAILVLHSTLMRDIDAECLRQGKGQQILFILEKYIEDHFSNFSQQSQKTYIDTMGQFLLRINYLEDDYKGLEVLDPRDYCLIKDIEGFFLPVNTSFLRKYLEEEIQIKHKDPKELKHMSLVLNILNSLSLKKSFSSCDKLLQSTWEKVKEDESYLNSLIEIFEKSQSFQSRFFQGILSQDPEAKKLLLQHFNKGLKRVISDDNQTRSKLISLARLLALWEINGNQFNDSINLLIEKNLENLEIKDILAALDLISSTIKSDKYEEIQTRLIEKLRKLIETSELDIKLTYSILMTIDLDKLKGNAIDKLNQIIISNFGSYNVENIANLVKRLEGYQMLTSELLSTVEKHYFANEYFLNMKPAQLKVLCKVLLTKNYPYIRSAIELFLIKNKNKLLSDKQIAELLFEHSCLDSKDFSEELIEVLTQTLHKSSLSSSPESYLYVLAALTNVERSQSQKIFKYDENKLQKIWSDILQRLDQEEFKRVLNFWSDRSKEFNLLEKWTWLDMHLLKEKDKRKI